MARQREQVVAKGSTARGTKRIVGYKYHVKTDADNKLIDDYRVPNTALNDSNSMPEMISEDDKMFYADNA